MTDLSNGNDWLKIYDQFHVAQAISNKPGKYYPIQGIVIPTTLDNYTATISLTTTNAKPTWHLGGRVFPIITVFGSDIGDAKTQYSRKIPLNQPTIITFRKISNYYRIGVAIPSWFTNVYLQAWVYTGQETPDGLEGKVEQIQSDLKRIEYKIDAIETYGNQ